MSSGMARVASAPTAPARAIGILRAIWGDPGQPTSEVATEEVRQILADGSAIVVDTRSTAEFAVGHLPGVRHIATRADGPAAQYVAAVARLVGGNKDTALSQLAAGRETNQAAGCNGND